MLMRHPNPAMEDAIRELNPRLILLLPHRGPYGSVLLDTDHVCHGEALAGG
jgi:hypothetical protein